MPKQEPSEPIRILRQLLTDVKLDEEFSFECKAGEGDKLLHRMRVELSRLRTKAKSRGMVPKHFKILHLRTEGLAETKFGLERITVKKTRSGNDVSTEVHALLKEISLT